MRTPAEKIPQAFIYFQEVLGCVWISTLRRSRLIKRRTVANEAARRRQRVTVNGKAAKAGTVVKVGDVIEVQFGDGAVRAEITQITETTRKEEALRGIYEVGFPEEGIFARAPSYTQLKQEQSEKRGEQMVETATPHRLVLENRSHMEITGVLDLLVFDESGDRAGDLRRCAEYSRG